MPGWVREGMNPSLHLITSQKVVTPVKTGVQGFHN